MSQLGSSLHRSHKTLEWSDLFSEMKAQRTGLRLVTLSPTGRRKRSLFFNSAKHDCFILHDLATQTSIEHHSITSHCAAVITGRGVTNIWVYIRKDQKVWSKCLNNPNISETLPKEGQERSLWYRDRHTEYFVVYSWPERNPTKPSAVALIPKCTLHSTALQFVLITWISFALVGSLQSLTHNPSLRNKYPSTQDRMLLKHAYIWTAAIFDLSTAVKGKSQSKHSLVFGRVNQQTSRHTLTFE